MSPSAAKLDPREVESERRANRFTAADHEHAETWAHLPETLRADLLLAVGLRTRPDVSWLFLRPDQRQLIRDEACARIGLASVLGGFLA